MHSFRSLAALTFVGALFASTTAVRAGFAGQPILGILGPGSNVSGNTTGHADDNDGFTSGDHIFDIWDGPDDVWQLNWPGGSDLTVSLAIPGGQDLDLFVYDPINGMDDAAHYSAGGDNPEIVTIPLALAPAGTYMINIDSDGAAGAYNLSINNVPEPTSLSAVVATGALVALRRRRAN